MIVPAMIADLGENAAMRFIDFFTAHIPQPEHAGGVRRRRASILRLVRGAEHAADRSPATD